MPGCKPVIIQSDEGHEFVEKVRAILLHEWDPIGVGDVPEANDEYDAYVGPVLQILCGSRSPNELTDFFHRVETKEMCLHSSGIKHQKKVADALLHLEVKT